MRAVYLRALENPLLDGSLPPRLPPLIAQHFFSLYDAENRSEALQAIAILLDVDCLDIHQVIFLQFFFFENKFDFNFDFVFLGHSNL